MFTIDDVRKKADELHARRAQELKDLDVDRVDGVDRPATGRSFLLMKSEGDALYLTEEDVVEKVSFADVMIGPATRTYPVESQEVRTGPRVADEGEDALDRAHDDSVMERIAGANGTGTSREDFPPAPRGENFQTAGGELVSPPEQYRIEEDVTYKLPGGMRMLSPQASGIPTPLDFRAPEPAQVEKRAPGLFRSILDPDRGPSRTGNFFDPAPSDAKIAKSKGGLFTSAVFGDGE